MAKTIHSMIRVLDEVRSVDFYSCAFGLDVADRLDFESFTLIYMSNAESGFEPKLTVNKGRTEPYDLGDGYGHLAVSVSDLDAEHACLTGAGLSQRKLVEFKNGDTLVALFSSLPTPMATRSRVLNAAAGSRDRPQPFVREERMKKIERTGLTWRTLLSRSVAAGALCVAGAGFIAAPNAAWAVEVTVVSEHQMATPLADGA